MIVEYMYIVSKPLAQEGSTFICPDYSPYSEEYRHENTSTYYHVHSTMTLVLQYLPRVAVYTMYKYFTYPVCRLVSAFTSGPSGPELPGCTPGGCEGTTTPWPVLSVRGMADALPSSLVGGFPSSGLLANPKKEGSGFRRSKWQTRLSLEDGSIIVDAFLFRSATGPAIEQICPCWLLDRDP